MKIPVWLWLLLSLSACTPSGRQATTGLDKTTSRVENYNDWGYTDSAIQVLLPAWKSTADRSQKEVLANYLVRTFLASDTPRDADQWVDSLKQVTGSSIGQLTANSLGSWYLAQGKKDSAVVFFRLASQAAEEQRPGERARAWLNLAIHYHGSQPDSAFTYYHMALHESVLSQAGLALLEARINNNLGNLYIRQRSLYDAEAAYLRAFRRLEKSYPQDFPYLLRTRLFLGYTWSDMCRYDDAITELQAALKGYQSRTETTLSDLAGCYVRLAAAWQGKGDIERALSFFDQAIESYRTLSTTQPSARMRLAEALNNRALACYSYKNYQESLKNLRESAQVYEALGQGQKPVMAVLTTNLAHISLENREQDSASKYYALTRQLIATLTLSGVPSSSLPNYFHLYSEGEFHHRRQEYTLASPYYAQAITEAEAAFGPQHGRTSQARLAMARNMWDMGLKPEAWHWLHASMVGLVKDSTRFDQNGNPDPGGALALDNLLECLWQKATWEQGDLSLDPIQRLARSVATYRTAVALSDSLELGIGTEGAKYFWLEQAGKRYHEAFVAAVRLYEATGKETDAGQVFFFAEKGKAALLREAWQESEAKSYAGIPESLLLLENRIRADLSFSERQLTENPPEKRGEWQKRIFENRSRYDSLLAVFESAYPEYHKLKYEVSVPPLSQVQALLPKNATLLEYVTGDSGVFVVGIQPENIFVKRLPVTESSLDSTVNAWRKWMVPGKKGLDTLAKTGFALYRQVLAPIAPLLSARLLVATDGPLGLVPFEAMLTEEVIPGKDPSEWPYVLNRFTCSYVFAASLLQEMQSKEKMRPPGKSMLAVAPVFSGIAPGKQATRGDRELLPLAYNRQEAESVSGFFHGKTLLNNDASKERFLEIAPDYRLIHLSSHGVIHNSDSRYSYIAFARSGQDSVYGKLYVSDLYNLRLPAEMVVLSACETGIGQWKRGEGIISLARGFSYAGAKSIVTTLWGVNDYLTAELMTVFYQKLESGLSKDEALREAKRTLILQGWGPYYWAAPIVVGNIQPLSKRDFPYRWVGIAFGLLVLAGTGWFFGFNKHR